MGAPLLDLDETILGNVAVLDTRPMPEEARNITLVKIFADRAASELRRLNVEDQLRQRTEEHQKEYRRKSSELEDARMMQLNMLPQAIPANHNYQFLFSEHAASMDILIDFHRLYMAFAIGRLTDNTLEQLELKGLPLGSKTFFPYAKITTHIEPNDVVVLMTDGLAELFNKEGDMLGYERVSELILEVVHPAPKEMIDHLYEAAASWLNGSSQNDEITFFIFKRNPC